MAKKDKTEPKVYPRSSYSSREPIINEIRECLDEGQDYWRDNRDEARIDKRYVSGDPWDEDERSLREEADRPVLSSDELGQYLNQVVNEVIANPRAIHVSPGGDGAQDDAQARQTAIFYGDKIREIEYRSNASVAYAIAFQNAIESGFGAVRVNAEWSSDRSFTQELTIDPIVNPDLLLLDPSGVRPSSSDIKWGIYSEKWRYADFTRRWPKAKTTSFSIDNQKNAPRWMDDEWLMVGEYWRVETVQRKLMLVQPPAPKPAPGSIYGLNQLPAPEPIPIFDDEIEDLPEGAKIVTSRDVDWPSVKQYLTNGFEILEDPTPWKGKSIPFATCYGKVLYMDEAGESKRKVFSMTRMARDPVMYYAYVLSSEAEMFGLPLKVPYFAYRGTLKPDQLTALQESVKHPIAVIEVDPVVDPLNPTQVLPLPQRQITDPPIQSYEVAREGARRMIQSAMGSNFLPTQAQRINDKSGVALRSIGQAASKGTFHFVDHFDGMVKRTGEILVDAMEGTYDTARYVNTRTFDGVTKRVRINDPTVQAHPPIVVKGIHQVTIGTGPKSDSERDQAADFITSALTNPQVLNIIGPVLAKKLLALAVQFNNLGPVGDQIISLLDPKSPDDPNVLQNKMQQAEAMIQKLQAALQKAENAIQVNEGKQMGSIAVAHIDADKSIKLQQMKDATTIRAAEITATKEILSNAQKAEDDAVALAQDQAHEVGMTQVNAAADQAAAAQANTHQLTQTAATASIQPTPDQTAQPSAPEQPQE